MCMVTFNMHASVKDHRVVFAPHKIESLNTHTVRLQEDSRREERHRAELSPRRQHANDRIMIQELQQVENLHKELSHLGNK
jgi:hypothetical protein